MSGRFEPSGGIWLIPSRARIRTSTALRSTSPAARAALLRGTLRVDRLGELAGKEDVQCYFSGGMTPNERIVADLCRAFDRMDADEIIGFFAPDAIYHNVPLRPSRGRDEIYESLRGLPSRFRAVRTEILRQISVGDLVMNERIDYFTFDDREVALPIAGVFELRGGKVVAWRDYFDLGTLRTSPEAPAFSTSQPRATSSDGA